MYIVAAYHWQQDETVVATTIAKALNILVFEARQKIAGGEPVVLASFADQHQAAAVATKLSRNEVPAVVINTLAVRSRNPLFRVCRFELGEQTLQIESFAGDQLSIRYDTIDLLLVATHSGGQIQTTTTVTQRKFSLGKTLLAGGVPMTKKVKNTETQTTEERDKTLWLYSHQQEILVFDRMVMNYAGLGDALQMTRELNFTHLQKELQRLAPQAHYNERLLKRSEQIRILGSCLNPETDLELAFEVLSQSLKKGLHCPLQSL